MQAAMSSKKHSENGHVVKIVVSGPFGSGKTQFITTLSEIDPVSTEIKLKSPDDQDTKISTTVGLDYGRMSMDNGRIIHLFGTPGQKRFDFMREVLAVGAHGLIILIDSTLDDTYHQAAQEIVDFFRERNSIPMLVCFTKQDLPQARPVAELEKVMDFPGSTPTLPIDATQRQSAHQAVEKMLAILDGTA